LIWKQGSNYYREGVRIGNIKAICTVCEEFKKRGGAGGGI